MNNFPTMLAVSRQYMFELKWQNTFTNFSSVVELTATRFQGRPTSGKSNVVGRSGNYRIWRNLTSEKLRAKKAGFLLSLCFVFLKKSILFVLQNVQYWMKKMDAAQWSNQSSRGNVLCFYKLCLVLRIIAFVLFVHLSILSKTHRWWEGKICSLL